MGFPGGTSGKKSTCQCRSYKRWRFHPWVGKIPRTGNVHPLQYSYLENPHGQRSLADYSPWGRKELDTTEATEHACSSVQSLSCVRLLPPHGPQHARPPCPSPTPGVYSLMPIELVMPFNHLILCRLLFLLPSIFPSIRVFWNESAFHIRLSKYWSFNFNMSPSNKYLGLISFRMDWLDLLAVQGILKGGTQNTVA